MGEINEEKHINPYGCPICIAHNHDKCLWKE